MSSVSKIIDTRILGVSFSIKTCRDYQIDWQKCLEALIGLGIKRFRLMSYWDLHEKERGGYDFSLLDQQLKIIRQAGATVTLSIGMRQPRWPETHLPEWALSLTELDREAAYLLYHQTIIDRYKDETAIESWQLENEFWNRGFGLNNNFSRPRLEKEFSMIRVSDSSRPIIMSLGNTTGYPLGLPRADLYGTTIYLIQYEKGKYSKTKYPAIYFRLRRRLIQIFTRRDLIIHELQAEPWGPRANWEMIDEEQAKSMTPVQLKKCVAFARTTKMKYIDLWGGEWWYWRYTKRGDTELWNTVKQIFNS